MHSQALELAKTIQDKLAAKGQTLELTGHSMGGGVANYVGLKLNLPAVCYNSAALGRACLKDIGEANLENLKKQTHISPKTCLLMSLMTSPMLRQIFIF
jgi:putative lipase involved disintegration of autophagic bodies